MGDRSDFSLRVLGTFWLDALGEGVSQLNSAAGLAGTVILGLGVTAGITVPQVFHHVSLWFTAVMLLSALVVALALGSYRVWHETDRTLKRVTAGGGAQAKLVGVWKVSELFSGIFTAQIVQIHVKNGSDKRISNLIFSWCLGTEHLDKCDEEQKEQWSKRDELAWVQPGDTVQRSRRLPKGISVRDVAKAYSADVYFQDDSNVYWCATPREDGGALVQRLPAQEPSPAS